MRVSLLLVAVSSASGALVNMGHLSSSNASVACTGSSNRPVADCKVEYASNATMPINNFAYVLQASAGDRAATGTNELAILNFTGSASGTSVDTDQVAWVNGTTYTFNISYNATTRALLYEISGGSLGSPVQLTYTGATQPIKDVFFKTNAVTANSQALISNITINGISFGTEISQAIQSVTNRQIDYVWITGLANANFTMSGNLKFSWSGTAPTGTNLVSYIKLGEAMNPGTYVPEPASLGCCGAALVALGCWARRRSR